MADVIYNNFREQLMEAGFNFIEGEDTIKIILVTSGYTPDQDAHDFYDDVTNELSTQYGYTSGGATLTTKTVTQDDTDDEGVFDADDVTWNASGGSITARGAILYKDSGLASTSPLIAYIDFGVDKTAATGYPFTIEWGSEGIINLT